MATQNILAPKRAIIGGPVPTARFGDVRKFLENIISALILNPLIMTMDAQI
jgi:hypothetical protein